MYLYDQLNSRGLCLVNHILNDDEFDSYKDRNKGNVLLEQYDESISEEFFCYYQGATYAFES